MLGVEETLAQRRRERCRTQRVRTCALRAAAAVALALVLAACGSSPTASDLFKEYLESTNVKGDEFRGATTADRLAEFAAEGGPSEAVTRLLAAYPCSEVRGGCPSHIGMKDFTGATGTVFKRNILVKHQDGQLELMPLYVVRKPDGANELVDDDAKTYSGGLDDFRRHNELLSADDQILTPRDITATSGKNEIIVVSGHTTGLRWKPWLIGIGIVAVVVVGTELLRILIRRGGSSSD